LTSFALVVSLGAASGHQLHTAGDLALSAITDQEMDMVRRNDVIQNTKPIAFLGLKQPMAPTVSISGEFQQKLLFVAAVGNVPDVAGQEMTIGAWHQAFSLKRCFCP
jgi:hypothetical protein